MWRSSWTSTWTWGSESTRAPSCVACLACRSGSLTSGLGMWASPTCWRPEGFQGESSLHGPNENVWFLRKKKSQALQNSAVLALNPRSFRATNRRDSLSKFFYLLLIRFKNLLPFLFQCFVLVFYNFCCLVLFYENMLMLEDCFLLNTFIFYFTTLFTEFFYKAKCATCEYFVGQPFKYRLLVRLNPQDWGCFSTMPKHVKIKSFAGSSLPKMSY